MPWAKSGSGFTLLFEHFAIELVKIHGCVAEVARQLNVYPQRLWRIIQAYGKELSADKMDMSKVTRIGFDETSRKKGHDYITCFIVPIAIEIDTGDLLYTIEGKSSETVVVPIAIGIGKQAVLQGLDKEKV